MTGKYQFEKLPVNAKTLWMIQTTESLLDVLNFGELHPEGDRDIAIYILGHFYNVDCATFKIPDPYLARFDDIPF